MKSPSYISADELEEFKKMSLLQRQRILLRAYLYEFQELALKYAIDNVDNLQTEGKQGDKEAIIMVTPQIENTLQDEKDQEYEHSEAAEEKGEEEEEDAQVKVHKSKGPGLNKDTLNSLNEKAAKKVEQTKNQSSLLNIEKLNQFEIPLETQKDMLKRA